MDTVLVVVLSICAFLLGACPFSLWIGKLALHRDIRIYADGNPGATNVFRAGGKLWGVVALLADILKGTPFILIAKSVVGLAAPFLYLIAFCAILGHAFSPFLGFRGGKALAVFGGTLLALNQWDVITVLAVLFLAGFFFIGNDSWIVILGILVTIVFCLWMRSDVWQIAFVGCVTALFIYKHWDGLKAPNHSGRLVNWIRSRKKPA